MSLGLIATRLRAFVLGFHYFMRVPSVTEEMARLNFLQQQVN